MPPLATAAIIAIGTELLTPDKTDTNSLFITARLNDIGIDVVSKAIVGDDPRDLERAVAAALERADVVITSGGLGPTADDLTREAVAAVLGRALREDPAIVQQLVERFAARGVPMADINRRQALVPEGATVLANRRGSAPGLLLTRGDQVVVLLPGPPREMQPMFEDVCGSALAPRSGGRVLRRRVLKIAGQPESQVDAVAAPVYSPLASADPAVLTTILAGPGQVELHVSARGTDAAQLDSALDAAVAALQRVLGADVFSVDGASLEAVVGARLRERGLTVALAESCTGGLAAGRLTAVPGSSSYVRGGVVAYSNDVKAQVLGVPTALLASVGAVSEPVAAAMAEGVRRVLGADIGVSITGIAGPDGGTEEKPVGTMCFSVAGPGSQVHTFTRRLPGDREHVRRWAVVVALDAVRRAVL